MPFEEETTLMLKKKKIKKYSCDIRSRARLLFFPLALSSLSQINTAITVNVTVWDTQTHIEAVIITDWLWLLWNFSGRLQERSANSFPVRPVIYSHNQAQSGRKMTLFFYFIIFFSTKQHAVRF